MAAAKHAQHKVTPAEPVLAIRALLDAGVDIDARDKHGNTALFHATRSHEVAAALLAAGCCVDAQNATGDTALTTAAANLAANATLRLLADSGAWTGQKNTAGESAVTIAVKQIVGQMVHYPGADEEHASTVRTLLALGCPVNEQDANGDTPLIVAARAGEVKVVEELLRHKARKDLRNRAGETALDAAKANVISALDG